MLKRNPQAGQHIFACRDRLQEKGYILFSGTIYNPFRLSKPLASQRSWPGVHNCKGSSLTQSWLGLQIPEVKKYLEQSECLARVSSSYSEQMMRQGVCGGRVMKKK